MRVQIEGDSNTTIEWLNGRWDMKNPRLAPALARARRSLYVAWGTGRVNVATDGADWARHIYREYNKDCDATATAALERQCEIAAINLVPWELLRGHAEANVVARFDGGRREGKAGAAWALWVKIGTNMYPWMVYGFGAGSATSSSAELAACSSLCTHIEHMAEKLAACGMPDLGIDEAQRDPRRIRPRLALADALIACAP